MVDSHSKWPEVCIMNKTSADKTIAVLRDIFARNGLPRELVSDNGPQFTSQQFTKFMSTNGIRHVTSSPYHPASNGAVERFVQTVKKALYAGEKDGMTLEMALANIPFAVPQHTPSYNRVAAKFIVCQQGFAYTVRPAETRCGKHSLQRSESAENPP